MMERRAYPRVEVSHAVLYFSDDYPRPKVASTLELSLGGTKIESPYSLTRDEGLEITIAIHPQAIKCRGKVMRVLWLENGKIEAGIQFEGLPEHDRLYLRQYLFHVMEQKAMESIPSPEKTPL